jgi:arylsulfatase A-like enzyme
VWKNPSSDKPNILVIMVDQLRFPQGLFTQEIMDTYAPVLAGLREKSVSFESH